MAQERKPIDWELVEKHYRAGIKTVRQLAVEYGVSHTAIQKRATKFAWVRDLSEKIQQTAKSLVSSQVVAKLVATETKLSDAQTIKAYSEVVASVDMVQREDLGLAIDVARSQMVELAALGNPRFVDALEWLADSFDKSDVDDNGREKVDKQNELYRYIISLPGRVKMTKELGSAYGIYIPLQRKVFGLDGKDTGGGAYEELLRSVGQGC